MVGSPNEPSLAPRGLRTDARMTIDFDEVVERDDRALHHPISHARRLRIIAEACAAGVGSTRRRKAGSTPAYSTEHQPFGHGLLDGGVPADQLQVVAPHRQPMQISRPLPLFQGDSSDASYHCRENQVVCHKYMHARRFSCEE